MLGHVSLGTKNLAQAATFYDATLNALGCVRLWTGEGSLGYGELGSGERLNVFERPGSRPPGDEFHLALNAPSTEAIDRFHAAALANGGQDMGAPGLREHYGPTYYYAASALDLDGHMVPGA
ncbi:MAG: VOC family protein [Candidatus Devosia symbiotica]|nr:VOC family protein [Candidatus Devosia symbiotica]